MVLRVVVVADEASLRDTLITEVETVENAVLVAAGAADDEELSAVPADVAIWDLGGDVTAARIQLARGLVTDVPVLILGPAGLGPEAMGAGGRGYLHRESPARRLSAALRAVAEGLQVIDARDRAEAEGGDGVVEDLTPRETDVLQLLAEGLPNKEIARRLRISEHTVKFHVNTIFGKLGARSRTEAVTRAARQGLIIL